MVEVLVAELDVVCWDVVELLVAGVDVVGWGTVEVVVDEEMELVAVMAFVYDSLSHNMLLDVALDLQNLHIYSKYVHILHIYTQN